jgi:hypothetical protein
MGSNISSLQEMKNNRYLSKYALAAITIAVIILSWGIFAQTNYCLTSIAAREKQTSVTLTWPHDGSTSYTIYRSITGPSDGFSAIATTNSTYSTYMDNTVSVNKMYYYRAESANGCFSPVVNTMPRVRAKNLPPTITSTPLTTATMGQVFKYQVTATDPNNDQLSFFLDVAPQGVEYRD